MPNENAYRDSRENVEAHLERLRCSLNSEHYELDILPAKKGESYTDPYSTFYTMLELGFDTEDIRDILLNLTAEDYIENMMDSRKSGGEDFRVFGISIAGREIYIKEKLRASAHVFCISFHFAKYRLKERPYQ